MLQVWGDQQTAKYMTSFDWLAQMAKQIGPLWKTHVQVRCCRVCAASQSRGARRMVQSLVCLNLTAFWDASFFALPATESTEACDA